MKRSILLCAFLLVPVLAFAQPLIKPFPFVMPSYDSTRSAWLPAMEIDNVDSAGYLSVEGNGHLAWSNGTRARFVGASVTGSACFPDSIAATATARRLRKLGVNMLRFDYFDYHNSDGASTLAPGKRSDSLSPTQMKRLDWFLYQLKLNGIHAHFVLKARNGPRRDDGVPGWDSAYNSGQYITYISEPFQQMQRLYMTKLFDHVNPYTQLRYGDDPEIALMTITDQNSFYDAWIGDRLNQRSGVLSYYHSRLLDTMFAGYLRAKYGTTAALKNAYYEGSHTLGPNLVANPGFESYTDNWNLQVGEGAQATSVIVQGNDVAPALGPNSLRVVVRKANGTESRIYLEQDGMKILKGHVYRLRFMVKTDSAAGRQIHAVMMRGTSPNDNLGVNELFDVTTQWRMFDFTFRALGTDTLATIFRIYIGKSIGDIFLDGFTLEETGREGLADSEKIENATVARAKFRDAPKLSLARMYDQVDFYDSLARAYYRGMRAHLHSLGVKGLIAGTNNTSAAADTWAQSEFDFTSETAAWDFNGARTGSSYSDSTWVVRNYSVLKFRDQKIPELSHNAIVGKPFIAEQYSHIFPNAHRPEMMLFLPSYASLHDWDGIYFYSYSDRSSEMGDRRRVFKDDFTSFMADPSICALLPQASAAVRGGWIAPATRTIKFEYDVADLRYLPVTYYSRGTYDIEGSFSNVINLVDAVRADSFAARRHYTADDYYVTIPADDDIESDTRQIKLDITKGIMQLNTPRVQGGAGAINAAASVRTDNLGVTWIDEGTTIAYLWTSLDGHALDSARRSLFTVTTRALNSGAVWQFGDSSLGKNWGAAPIVMEATKIGVNFYTNADSLVVHPLDTFGLPTDRTIPATRVTSGSWRVTLDLDVERTPWFGVEQHFAGDSSVSGVRVARDEAAAAGSIYPNPASDIAMLEVSVPGDGVLVSARVIDLLGRTLAAVPEHRAVAGRSQLELDLRNLPTGTYVCVVTIGERTFARKLIVKARE
jgi:hypothetical protein